ncbi:MAG: carbamoyl-phosphate synthase large subunit, partial [Leptonema sp. (in: Bacteria)]|nr:carbamoyl-phosphate synthase large subunit [Leptonema sp. (in: bacteria)]
MPRRTDIDSILIPGSGPIVIGQACEFDYSGTQACRALRQEGYRTILLNSNPATIMTDPELADATYIEPMTKEILIQILDKEKPSAILPTVGGQTALNLVMELYKAGEIQKRGIKLLGASAESIDKAESRSLFKDTMVKLGYEVPESALCNSLEEAKEFHNRMGLPLVIRPSFTLGGTGGGIIFTEEEFNDMCQAGLDASPTHQILLEQSVLGWKEIEIEIVRDRVNTSIIICSIENLDPMGVHTGDSITVAPQQTLTDQEYQELRNASIEIMNEIGLNSGGSNIQFAVNPDNGKWVVIEMNPRVSRSSALASKATGFPIATVSALLSVGYTLDEIPNRMTKTTFASFEPAIDYVVTKVPRFTFEKFPGSKPVLGSMMKSVGETMAIGRTFQSSFQKAFRSLETGRFGFGADGNLDELFKVELHKAANTLTGYLEHSIQVPNPDRIFDVRIAIESDKLGLIRFPLEKIYELSKIDYWFLNQFEDWINQEIQFSKANSLADSEFNEALTEMKERGYSDRQLAFLLNRTQVESLITDESKSVAERRKLVLNLLKEKENQILNRRKEIGLRPVYRRIDTCAAANPTDVAYLYSEYQELDESLIADKKKVIILGGGPNRIGQGIEFDYCCCHAAFALEEMGIHSVMVNSNPETVSTDYDTSDVLYFEPLTIEDVLHICENEKPWGVIVQFGGQTPLRLAQDLAKAGVPIIGTSPDSIDRAEDRDLFSQMIEKLGLLQPPNAIAHDIEEAIQKSDSIGYPCL